MQSVLCNACVGVRTRLGIAWSNRQFKQAAKLGVTKINIDTDGRLVWTRVHREMFQDHPEVFDLRTPGKLFMQEYANFIADKNEYLGSAGELENVRKYLAA